jgi:hypothetical protein
VPAGVLVTGSNTIDLLTPAIAGVDSQTAMLHSLTVKYTKALSGTSSVAVNVSAKIPQIYEVSGLSGGALWVVDARLADRAALVPYEAQAQGDGTFKARFYGQPGGTGQYVVVVAGSELAPLSVTKRTVKPVRAVQYLAVGPAQFGTNVQPLVAAHAAEGLTGAFVDQEAVFDYYGFGRFGPDGIRKAVRQTRPQFLLLVGRTTYDYLNYQGASVDPLCPTFLISTSFWAEATSDAQFGDLGRGYPEVAVGRLPVNDAAELTVAVGRILAHQGLAESGWRAQAVADAPDVDAGDFPAEADSIVASSPQIAWTKNYLTDGKTPVEVNADMDAAANGGADVILYVGHGNAARLGKDNPRILDVDSVQEWTGNVVLLQATCTANWVANDVDSYHSIAIQGLTQPQGGIAASIGTTTYMESAPGTAFMRQLIAQAQASNMRWGTAVLRAQQWAWSQSGAQASWFVDLSKTESILGDPAMPVYGK